MVDRVLAGTQVARNFDQETSARCACGPDLRSWPTVCDGLIGGHKVTGGDRSLGLLGLHAPACRRSGWLDAERRRVLSGLDGWEGLGDYNWDYGR